MSEIAVRQTRSRGGEMQVRDQLCWVRHGASPSTEVLYCRPVTGTDPPGKRGLQTAMISKGTGEALVPIRGEPDVTPCNSIVKKNE